MPAANNPNPASRPTTLVVGGGWAGLSSAVTLTQHGHKVTLLESAKQPGGRARTVELNGLHVDNGQHLMIGAYTDMLGILQAMGIDEQTVLARSPMRLLLRSAQSRDIELRIPQLPVPLHMASAFLFARGIKAADKWKALRFCLRMLIQDFSIEKDCTLKGYLQEQGQSPYMIQNFWAPLCIGALNTNPQQASTQLFLQVLKRCFTGKRSNSDLLIAKCNLGDLLPQPATDFIIANGSKVQLNQQVTELHIEHGQIQGVETTNGFVPAQQVILALPPWRSLELLSRHQQLAPVTERLEKLCYQPICTVYLQYSADIQLTPAMVGIRNGISQWLFDRRVCKQPGLMAIVISTDGPHMEWDNETLAQRVRKEISLLYPHWPEPAKHYVIREKRATFSSRANINEIRPAHHTPVAGLWLAGDYTDTGLPATLEGAIASGVQCAREILEETQ